MPTNTIQLEGFLQELGLGPINKAEAYEKGLGSGIQGNQSEVSAFMQLGQQMGRGVGRAGAGLLRGLTDDEKGLNFKKSVQDVDDAIVARGAGIAGGAAEVRSRRELRKKIAEEDFGDLSKPSARIKLAKFVAEQAQKDGNITAQAAAMSKVQSLKAERREANKLKAVKEEAEGQAHKANMMEVLLDGESTPVEAQRTVRGRGKNKIYGVETFTKDGKVMFHPAGTFQEWDAAKNKAATLDADMTIGAAWQKNHGDKDLRVLSGQLNTGM